MKDLIVSKLKEGSTWAGVGAIVAALSFPHAAELGVLMPSVGVVVAGVLAIFFP